MGASSWTAWALAAGLAAAGGGAAAETPGNPPGPRAAPAVAAEPTRSAHYLAACSARPGSAALRDCLSYVDGADAMHSYWAQLIDLAEVAVLGNTPLKALYCHPDDATNRDAAAAWVRWLEAHPDQHDEPPVVTLLAALRAAYPCE